MIRHVLLSALALLTTTACARPSQFDRYLTDERWADAAREFAADSSLLYNEDALYHAALLYATPGQPPYDPGRARLLFSTLLARFPKTKHTLDATVHLRVYEEARRATDDAAAQRLELENRIAALTRETQALRSKIDSTAGQPDSLRAVITRLEGERRDRDEQLRALRLELQRLKDIDLKPRPPIKP